MQQVFNNSTVKCVKRQCVSGCGCVSSFSIYQHDHIVIVNRSHPALTATTDLLCNPQLYKTRSLLFSLFLSPPRPLFHLSASPLFFLSTCVSTTRHILKPRFLQCPVLAGFLEPAVFMSDLEFMIFLPMLGTGSKPCYSRWLPERFKPRFPNKSFRNTHLLPSRNTVRSQVPLCSEWKPARAERVRVGMRTQPPPTAVACGQSWTTSENTFCTVFPSLKLNNSTYFTEI